MGFRVSGIKVSIQGLGLKVCWFAERISAWKTCSQQAEENALSPSPANPE